MSNQDGIFWPMASQYLDVKRDLPFTSPQTKEGMCQPLTTPTPCAFPTVMIIPLNSVKGSGLCWIKKVWCSKLLCKRITHLVYKIGAFVLYPSDGCSLRPSWHGSRRELPSSPHPCCRHHRWRTRWCSLLPTDQAPPSAYLDHWKSRPLRERAKYTPSIYENVKYLSYCQNHTSLRWPAQSSRKPKA